MNDNIIFDSKNAKTLDNNRMIHRLRLDNKYLQLQIAKLNSKIDKAIKKLEYYNSGEALYYVPIQDIIEILKGE